MHVKDMHHAQADPHLPVMYEHVSELHSVFPIPMQNRGKKGACIDTPPREQRSKETPSVKQDDIRVMAAELRTSPVQSSANFLVHKGKPHFECKLEHLML